MGTCHRQKADVGTCSLCNIEFKNIFSAKMGDKKSCCNQLVCYFCTRKNFLSWVASDTKMIKLREINAMIQKNSGKRKTDNDKGWVDYVYPVYKKQRERKSNTQIKYKKIKKELRKMTREKLREERRMRKSGESSNNKGQSGPIIITRGSCSYRFRRTIRVWTKAIDFSKRNCPYCKGFSSWWGCFKKMQTEIQVETDLTEAFGFLTDLDNWHKNGMSMLKTKVLPGHRGEESPEEHKELVKAWNERDYYQCRKCFTNHNEIKGPCEGGDPVQDIKYVCRKCSIGCSPDHVIQYKCYFCCKPSEWKCFGNRQFCNDCHDKWEIVVEETSDPVERSERMKNPCKGGDCGIFQGHPPNSTQDFVFCTKCQKGYAIDVEGVE